jgi:hypothetical protein
MRGDVFFTTLGEAKNWQRGNRRLFTLEKRPPKHKTKPQVFATCKNYKGVLIIKERAHTQHLIWSRNIPTKVKYEMQILILQLVDGFHFFKGGSLEIQ